MLSTNPTAESGQRLAGCPIWCTKHYTEDAGTPDEFTVHSGRVGRVTIARYTRPDGLKVEPDTIDLNLRRSIIPEMLTLKQAGRLAESLQSAIVCLASTEQRSAA